MISMLHIDKVDWHKYLTFCYSNLKGDVNPMGIRGVNSFHQPLGNVLTASINAPESKFVLPSSVWIGPFPKDVVDMIENDSTFSADNFKKWHPTHCESYMNNQLNNVDGYSFVDYGPTEAKEARRNAMVLMKNEKINLDAEKFEGVVDMLFQRAWAVVSKKQGWMGRDGI